MTKKLLIVDDSQIMRDAIRKFLEKFDLELVGSARDGEEAIRLFTETLPDLVTLDITMPKIDGLSAMQEMRRIKPDCQFIIVSAINDKAVVLRALDAGAAQFIFKPISEAAISAAAEKVLKKISP
jgi:two-component system, chemotaxis family, chemotaxis protein CheY